ncbi:MAG: DNA-3-methyladenine glycosylase I [Nocardioidaceae bacterium]
MTRGAEVGPDGELRCPWALSTPDYLTYHDDEWGRPIRNDNGLYERLTLEGFQSGLSWLTILRKRENFRAAFAGFDVATVAGFGDADRERLLNDAGIVRHRGKIDAALTNARAAVALNESLTELVWGFAPLGDPAKKTLDDVASQTPESRALAKELKRRGFTFVGPTTAYALMQAAGLVNDHLVDCWVRERI